MLMGFQEIYSEQLALVSKIATFPLAARGEANNIPSSVFRNIDEVSARGARENGAPTCGSLFVRKGVQEVFGHYPSVGRPPAINLNLCDSHCISQASLSNHLHRFT